MAYETGTATNNYDLLTKLKTFLTTNAALVAAGQQWQVKRWVGATNWADNWFKGPGTSGTDNIYVGIRAFEDNDLDIYNLGFRGAVGLLMDGSGNYTNGSNYDNQPGGSPEVYACASNTALPYWFVANGRRFIAIWKVSTTYHGMYCGFPLVYGTPTQYPYPLVIGGGGNTYTRRWSANDPDHRIFCDPGTGGMQLYYLDGTWKAFRNYYGSGSIEYNEDINNVWPKGVTWIRDNPDGSYLLEPFILNMNIPQLVGELEGVYWVSGFNNAAENTMTISGDTYVVFQNIFRTNVNDYFALRLQ